MKPSLSRRWFLAGSAVAALTVVVTACTPEPPAPTPTPTPTRAASNRPEIQQSYGPNGTHFPADAPWPGDTAATDLEVECSWVEIARRIQGLTAAEVAAGVIIRVAPGTLSGGGYTSSAQPVLANVGNQTWTRNVVIVPRDGYGSVSIAAAGARFEQCARLSFFGFQSSGGFVLTRCAEFQMGWSRFDAMSITRGGRNIAFYELIVGFRRNPEDTGAIRPTEAFEMTGLSRHGCVFGPSVKPEGSDAHCDTIQLEGTGSGPFGPFESTDCVDYGSSNAAELLHDQVSYAAYQHCLILGGQLPWQVYPLQAGDYLGEPNAFSGGCRDVRVHDSVVAGAVGRMGFTDVTNSTLSYTPVDNQQPTNNGSWTVDTDVTRWDRAKIMSLQAVDDYEESTLAALWTW